MALHTSTTFIHIVTNSLTVPQNHVSPRTWMTFNKEPLREYSRLLRSTHWLELRFGHREREVRW